MSEREGRTDGRMDGWMDGCKEESEWVRGWVAISGLCHGHVLPAMTVSINWDNWRLLIITILASS